MNYTINEPKVEEMKELIKYLNDATYLYNLGKSVVSDLEWDAAYARLEELEKETKIILGQSPTSNFPYVFNTEFKKIQHNHLMLSLAKSKLVGDIEKFVGKTNKFIAMPKFDGLTCSLCYRDGKLVSAETRGDGRIGEDITDNVRTLSSVPLTIPIEEEVVVDGELICLLADFAAFADKYKNPRNFAAGSARLLDSKECSSRKLTFVVWDIIKGFDDINSLTEKLNTFSSFGFMVTPYISEGVQESIDYIIDISKDTYPIDGVVFKFDDIKYGASLGSTDHHFNNAIAFKKYDEEYTSCLLDIEYEPSRYGQLTPVAVFEPIDDGESVYQRASLHNLSIIDELSGGECYKGDFVTTIKSNMIIPKVVKWEKGEGLEKIEIPKYCPVCGALTEVKVSDTDVKTLWCTNKDCGARFVNKLKHFCGKSGLDIKGVSENTLEKIIDWGWVSDYKDLFNLETKRQEWIKKEGFGVKSVDNILGAIETSRKCSLDSYIVAIGIPLIGRRAAKVLAETFNNWESFVEAAQGDYDFSVLENFGIEMNENIKKFDFTPFILLASSELDINSSQEKIGSADKSMPLTNLTFVITGKVDFYKNREEIKDVIEAAGGKVASSVTSKTSYLINNDKESSSSKNKQAQKLSIPILSEEEFIKILGER